LNRAKIALVAVAGVALMVREARADDADALVRHGLALRREHRDAEALAEFQRAYAAQPSARVRAQIALAEQAIGKWVEAELDLRAALDAADDAWIAANRAPLSQALRFVSSHLGSLVVECDVPGATILVNGERVGATPLNAPVRVVVGTALILVEADGYLPAERALRIDADDQAHEVVTLVSARLPQPAISPPVPVVEQHDPPPPPPPEPAPPLLPIVAPAPDKPHRPLPWAAIAATGIGVAGITVGTVYGLDVFSDKAARNMHCQGGCDSTGLADDTAARHAAIVSTVGFGAGLAGLLAGGWLFWRYSSHAKPVTVVPVASANGRGLVLAGAW
jgi:hypothetical protein